MYCLVSIILLLVASFGNASDLVKASMIISAGIFAIADCFMDIGSK